LSRARFVVLSIVVDAVVVNVGFVAAFLVRFQGSLPAFNFDAYLLLSPFLTLFFIGGAWTYGLYDPERADTSWAVARGVVAAVTVGTILTAAIAFFGSTRTASFARSTILLAWAIDLVLLTGWRLTLLRFGRLRWPEQRVLVVGTDDASIELAEEMSRRARWGWKVVGLIDTTREPGREPSGTTGGFEILGGVHDVARVTVDCGATRVIVVSPIRLRELVESLVLANEAGVRVDVVPELYEIFIGTVDAVVGDVPLMQITHSTVPSYYAVLKRSMDIGGAIVGLVLTSPIVLLAACAIVVSDGFPVVFSQERAGRHMRPFRIHKLRTMVRDAEAESGPVLAEEDDGRITRVGSFLRRFRIDELPQLVNVLKGEMSFVGPRPERPYFVRSLMARQGYAERFTIRPGVTGLAQVSGSYATTPERKLKYDLIYMYHQNLAMDAQIVLETLRVVLTGRGAR
jgi:exopolysaccharide biosynthesis polyprenyl glycosylphosphotransferase